MFKTPFKPTGHYVFNYKPRYYDERKQRLEAIEQRHKQKKNTNSDSDKFETSLSINNLKNDWSRSKSNHVQDHASNKRLAKIIVILIFCTWSFFNFDKITYICQILFNFFQTTLQTK